MIDKLHYISQGKETSSQLDAIKNALDAGCGWIQLRIKNQPESVILKSALEAAKLCEKYKARLIINDHPHIALESGAYGVHLGLNDMGIAKAREIIGKEMIIGGTANTFEHIRQRVNEGADYIGLGPYRFTTTKQNLSPVIGLEGYKLIMQQMFDSNIKIPVIAIGGITLPDISLIMQAKVYGVAISGALTNNPDKKKTIEAIYRLVGNTGSEVIKN
ncbi:thiamine phosphate synthase [Daejeonella sp. H1SJ63]|jgi:thiamine-phosphate pyrophosphorylase|uniref:thiamine phosphate synthase n=1 Tax=Daejeonella sp. H1SJ63 TaxID=3034145 RepID=UPI0023ED3E80|nr:thiamine phosphate synthase [Daejeonella sp. H1SJ63]